LINLDLFWNQYIPLKSLFSVGLGSILFAISIDNPDLNLSSSTQCSAEPLVPSLTLSDPVIAASDPGKNMAENYSDNPL
jgi:hypothetical protein